MIEIKNNIAYEKDKAYLLRKKGSLIGFQTVGLNALSIDDLEEIAVEQLQQEVENFYVSEKAKELEQKYLRERYSVEEEENIRREMFNSLMTPMELYTENEEVNIQKEYEEYLQYISDCKKKASENALFEYKKEQEELKNEQNEETNDLSNEVPMGDYNLL